MVLSNRQRKLVKKAIPKAPRGAEKPRIVNQEPPIVIRDGLDWLKRKKRLKDPRRIKAADLYRKAYREAGDVSIPSCLGTLDRVDHGAVAGFVAVAREDGKRLLLHLRNIVRAQPDLLTALDGICGIGWTPLELAGGNDRRARNLETALYIGLDQIADAVWPSTPLTIPRVLEHELSIGRITS
jgi:hypothetical protein